MTPNAPTGPEPTVTQLVSGIVTDAQDLVKQQVELLKHDLRAEFRQAKEATASLALGGAVLAVGIILLSLTVVHLVNWLIPAMPLWCCYALVGVVMCGGGWGALTAGKKKLTDLDPLHEQSVQAIKETVQWTTAPHTYGSR